jgi:16S rRNA (uracil1498-N3)-methyltransferase
MSVPRFFAPQLSGALVRLPDEEARHARQSRRLRVGDTVMLFDGCGREAQGAITRVERSFVEARTSAVAVQDRPTPSLTLAVAVPKGPRQDTLVEKCTELGVAELRPILTARSVCSASDHRLDKWRRITIEAAKQSGQCWLPAISTPRRIDEVLQEIPSFPKALVAVPGTESLRAWLGEVASVDRVLAFIGPEGGWTDAELSDLQAAGCKTVSLGPNVLRIETAAIVVAAVAHALAACPARPCWRSSDRANSEPRA